MLKKYDSGGERIERGDVQGIVISSYKYHECASYLLLQIDDPVATKRWLAGISARVTTSVKPPDNARPPRNLNLAITYSGLHKFAVPDDVLLTFSFPFVDGMHSDRRARILGDTGSNEPAQWWWGNAKRPVDIILMLYAADETDIDNYEKEESTLASSRGITVLEMLRAGRQPDTKEHFGFNDGVGQPAIDGTEQYERQLARTGHVTPLPPGEFLMSYEDAYGNMAPSPAVDAALDAGNLLPRSGDGDIKSKTHDLGRNGSYMVFRQLEQDVAAFWRFCDEATKNGDGSSEPIARDQLGAKFVGRWRSGTPLVLAPDRDTWTDPKTLNPVNDFDYSSDANGFGCPIGAHMRRANPRNSLGATPEEGLLTANRHRIMRRGRSYGVRLSEGDAHPMIDDGKKRGLHFICFNSDLQRQFEFVQQTWINNPQFGGLHNEVDPLIGDQGSCSSLMTIQADPLRSRIKNMCRFVTTRGGAYAFLPGLRALRWIANV
ncbi:MAG TPA: peroxidase [Thermoanaerobaculia bacterium]|jgi:Dyp-type peroxidase family|nr:peroxidase [Thermoanaerobaculia bacterium]